MADLQLPELLLYGAIGMFAMFIVALGLAFVILRRVKKIDLPVDASFGDALRKTPFLVAVFLDVLDLALDGFGAPVAWYVLGKLGLGKLKGVAVVEALVPFTQVIPTMTILWLGSRLTSRRETPSAAILPG